MKGHERMFASAKGTHQKWVRHYNVINSVLTSSGLLRTHFFRQPSSKYLQVMILTLHRVDVDVCEMTGPI